MRRRSVIAGLAALGLVTGILPATTARAATTYTIQMGADFFRQGVPGFSSRFYPTSIEMMSGDTVVFEGAAPAMLPVGLGPLEFREANMRTFGDPFFVFEKDSDENADALKLNLGAFEPTRDDCGKPATPCAFDAHGSEVLSGGDQARKFAVTISANPGDVFWAVLPFGDASNFRIEVVGDPADASTQAQLDKRGASLEAADFEDAAALDAKYAASQTKHKNKSGTTVHDAYAGVDQGPISLLAMYPKTLEIDKGDKVQWHFPFRNEVHSAVFSFEQAESMLLNNFGAYCDPDGDDGNAKDNPPDQTDPENENPCQDPSQAEIDMDPRERNTPRGDGVFNGKDGDLEYSGLRAFVTQSPGYFTQAPWTVKFSQRSEGKGYRYFCTIHGKFMGAVVKVD